MKAHAESRGLQRDIGPVDNLDAKAKRLQHNLYPYHRPPSHSKKSSTWYDN